MEWNEKYAYVSNSSLKTRTSILLFPGLHSDPAASQQAEDLHKLACITYSIVYGM